MREAMSVIDVLEKFGRLCLAGIVVSLASCTTQPTSPPDSAATRLFASTVENIPPASQELSFLHVDGRRIVDEQGSKVHLRGCNIGSWLLIEPWMLGLADGEIKCEKDMWDVLRSRFVPAQVQQLIRTYRDAFFTEADVQLIAETGMNCIRVPVWWRATSDPDYGGTFDDLDRCIEWCSENGVYVILDLHGCPGGQSKKEAIVGERSNADLWREDRFKDETVAWWVEVAERYKDSPAVAGYDLINEATDAPFDDMMDLYDRLYEAIRAVDSRHIIIMEDGLQGMHRFPHPDAMGWENVMYSTHYYPMSDEEGAKAASYIMPRFNRAVLPYDVPFFMGEFNTINMGQGGVDILFRLCEAFDYLEWPWTFWSYKKLEGNRDTNWGLVGYYHDIPQADLRHDSFEAIQAMFEATHTSNARANPLIQAALSSAPRWAKEPLRRDRLQLGVREAILVPAEDGDIRIEWGWDIPNIGFWKGGDTVAWRFHAPRAGIYELGMIYANSSDENTARIWIDGVQVIDARLENSQGWHRYRELGIARVGLSEGKHVVAVGQAGSVDGFVNLRAIWFRPAGETATPSEEAEIRLTPVNVSRIPPESPIRVEWRNHPPNFGFWHPRERAYWDVQVQQGGTYRAGVTYSSPNRNTRLRIVVDNETQVAQVLPETGGWHDFKTETGDDTFELAAGTHEIALVWETGNPTGAGNLRSVVLTKVEPEAEPQNE